MVIPFFILTFANRKSRNMMKTDKKIELLLTDLCARLPYGIFVKDEVDDKAIYTIDYHPHLRNCKPYLRPMSSMTEKEKEELKDVCVINYNEFEGGSTLFDEMGFDWLNAHYFDYRGFIPQGLAIEAPKNMYNIK